MKWIEQFNFTQVSKSKIPRSLYSSISKQNEIQETRTLEARSSSNSYRIKGVMFNKTGEHDSLES